MFAQVVRPSFRAPGDATAQPLSRGAVRRPVIQRKCAECEAKSKGLPVGKPDDALEKEADRVAEEMLSNKSSKGGCTKCGDKEPSVRRSVQSSAPDNEMSAPPIVAETLQSSAGHALDEQTRALFEPRLGLDLSGVRVHTGASADESAKAVNAKAYTVGRDIVFGAGHYAPHTHEGQRVLGHELTHVAQQGGEASAVQRILLLGGGYRKPPLPKEYLEKFIRQCAYAQPNPKACATCCDMVCAQDDGGVGLDTCATICRNHVGCAKEEEGDLKRRVLDALKILGLSVLLVVLVLVALADPEPTSKVAAVVGSVAVATQLLILLGMKPKDQAQPTS